MTQKKLALAILLCIFSLGTILRFAFLGSIPNGLEQDETSIGFNAVSILETGKDEYKKPFPILFKAFGDYKLPGYIYASVLPIRLFGETAFAVRFVSALTGSLTILCLYFLVKELAPKNETLPLLCAFLLAINPWHVHFSRGAFEVTLALFFITLGTLLWFIARRKPWLVPISLMLFLFSIYTYNIARLFIPIYVLLLFWYRKPKFTPRTLLVSFLVVCASGFLVLLQAKTAGGISATTGTFLFTSNAVRAPLDEFRAYQAALPGILHKPLFSLPIMLIWQYIQNIASYASVSFFFLTGSTHGNHGIGTVGNFYLFELPLMGLGIHLIFQKDRKTLVFLLLTVLAIVGVASLTRETPQATRSFFLILPLVILSAAGAERVIKFVGTQRALKGAVFALAGLGIFGWSLSFYLASYFIRFPIAYAKQWHAADPEVVQYLLTERSNVDKVVIDSSIDFPYTSLLWYSHYPAAEFQDNVMRAPDDTEGFSAVRSVERYEYRSVNWDHDLKVPHLLILTTPNKLPKDLKPSETFFFPLRPVVDSVKEVLFRVDVADAAYVAVRTSAP